MKIVIIIIIFNIIINNIVIFGWFKLNKVQFDSMAFQERNRTCGIKPKYSCRNLAEKSRTNQNLK